MSHTLVVAYWPGSTVWAKSLEETKAFCNCYQSCGRPSTLCTWPWGKPQICLLRHLFHSSCWCREIHLAVQGLLSFQQNKFSEGNLRKYMNVLSNQTFLALKSSLSNLLWRLCTFLFVPYSEGFYLAYTYCIIFVRPWGYLVSAIMWYTMYCNYMCKVQCIALWNQSHIPLEHRTAL